MRTILRRTCAAGAVVTALAAPASAESPLAVWLEAPPAGRALPPLASLSVVREDGTALALDLQPESRPSSPAHWRLVARGNVPLGRYAGLSLGPQPAPEPELPADGAATDDAAPAPPPPPGLPLAFEALDGRGIVVVLSPGEAGYSAALAARPSVEALGAVTLPEADAIALFDRDTGQVVDLVPTSSGPLGLDIGPASRRAFVTCARDGVVELVDLIEGRVVLSRPLRAVDAPSAVAVTNQGRTLLVANPGTGTVALLDAPTLVERRRARIGTRPEWLLRDRDGTRVFVFDELGDVVTIVDAGTGGVTGELTSPGGAFRGALDRNGERLYVIHRTSPYLGVFDTRTLERGEPVYIGLGATALAVDPRSGRIHVAFADPPRIDVFDPGSFLPSSSIAVPAPVGVMTRDTRGDRIGMGLATVNELRVIDLVGQRDAAAVELGQAPGEIAFVGER